MAKLFFDVFPTLDVSGDMKKILSEMEVTKVGMNHERDHIRVYLLGSHLIHKNNITQLERSIEEQIFKGKRMNVRIIEKYQLSEQYTARTLMDMYKDSMLEELKAYSLMEYNLLRASKMEFTDDSHLHLVLENTIIAQTRSHEIVEFLEKIVCERCGMNLIVDLDFEEPKESKYKKNSDLQIQFEIKNILKNINLKDEDGETVAVASDANEKSAASGQTTTSGDRGSTGGENAVKPAKNDAKSANGAGNTAKKPYDGPRKEFKKRYDGGGFGGGKKSDNPDVIYGRDIEDGETIPLEKIVGEMGEVTIRCQVMTVETREIRNEKTIIIMSVTDFTDSIVLKIFTRNEDRDELLGNLKKGAFLKIKGVTTIDKFDSELTIGSIVGIKKIADFTTTRMDTSPEKRVELHCHTKMSDMDGVSYAKDIIKQAISWGHKAIAITDHGVVQAFTEAYHTMQDLEFKYNKKGEKLDFKVIYGVEAYLVDDTRKIVINPAGQDFKGEFVVFDLETTGFSALVDRVIEIGAVKIKNNEIVDRFSTFVNPQIPISFRIENLTGINDQMVMNSGTIEQILPDFIEFCKGCVMVAHNAEFDMSFIINNAEKMGIEFAPTYIDTVLLSQFLIPALHNYKLDTLTKHLNVVLDNHHRAVDDAEATAHIFLKLVQMLYERDIYTLDKLNEEGTLDDESIKKLHQYHCIILASNEMGRINLYRLVSASHLQYFNRFPKIPKSLVNKYREGLIIGSACEAGELFRAMVNGRSDAEIARIVNFYDYLEVQPIGNNSFMIEKEDYYVKDEEDLRDLNRRVISLGEKFDKPVVATCDVHFLNPEDEIYRRIIMAGKGFDDADNQPPLYLHTTEEMLSEFDYLGNDKAYEIVVTNTNKIMDMCEKISPVRPDKRPPVIENSDQMLRNICHNRAHEIYGPELPQIVTERLERELNSIISNGYSVMYIIAQKLVWKSNDDGYLVGSRGSVGSSLAATMAGITEVNPLSPHYLCPECFYVDFDSEEVKKFAGGAGCDMPDKVCPNCGHKLNKLGFDIPFETFLGFKGNKEPDIDLNFSNEYQSKAHAYTEVIFGKGQTFKAGTIGTVAEKTAYGYVLKYLEERGRVKRRCEIERIAEGCIDIRRTTGQHPGGIVVLPIGDEIHSFTPVQHPANDVKSGIVTTHFDYHSIDHNLLKLDILGHLDPTMIRMLQDLTGIDPLEIPLDSREVMSLFKDTSALGITPEDIGGCKLGALGIPEFGTDFAMQMLIDTKPQYFSDLVRIAGLSHGTDVWLGNAQTLLKEGKATISTAICTRDDIMIYLIQKGLESELAFTIMEKVRKGKGLTPEWEQIMREHGVPDWYIWSCNKIQYMFPKAHAAAYVMMAWRVAYCKVFYPLAYYCAYYSIRANAFDYEKMAMGRERLEYYINDYKAKKADGTISNVEDDELKDMRIVQEMYARGFEFVPIDIYKAKARSFQIIDGKIMPSFKVISKVGESAGESIEIAARDGEFLSKDDLRQRARIGQTVIEKLGELGLLDGMAESNQLSLFDVI